MIFKGKDIEITTTDKKDIELFICAKWCIEPFMIQYNQDGTFSHIQHVLLTNKLGEVFADIGEIWN